MRGQVIAAPLWEFGADQGTRQFAELGIALVIGGGLIFVRRDAVRGLTTAATIWLTCAVGMACGGGLALLATAATAVHFLVVRGYPLFTRRLSAVWAAEQVEVALSYRVGGGLLPRVLELCTAAGFRVLRVRVDRAPWKGRDRSTRVVRAEEEARPSDTGVAEVLVALEGTGDVLRLVGEISELDGVLGADAGRDVDTSD